jgi:hypothetical protein
MLTLELALARRDPPAWPQGGKEKRRSVRLRFERRRALGGAFTDSSSERASPESSSSSLPG